jgi:site-specific recombinase XerD
LYGCGPRLFECLKLRVQDVKFDMGVLTVHDGKGKKDRTLPEVLIPELRAQLEEVIQIHRAPWTQRRLHDLAGPTPSVADGSDRQITQALPRSKPDVGLSQHPAFQQTFRNDALYYDATCLAAD